jgi:hypothetical protein
LTLQLPETFHKENWLVIDECQRHRIANATGLTARCATTQCTGRTQQHEPK